MVRPEFEFQAASAANIYTSNVRPQIKMWEAGFSGEQSAEFGPVMQTVRSLIYLAFLEGVEWSGTQQGGLYPLEDGDEVVEE